MNASVPHAGVRRPALLDAAGYQASCDAEA